MLAAPATFQNGDVRALSCREFVTLRGAGANATVITNNDAIGGLRLASVGDAHTLR